jgi:hypothetical protein
VALSPDGNTALVGASADGGDVGAVWVFTRSGTTWTQQGAKLTADDETGTGGFGISVALSSDGNTALVGGSADHVDAGAVWVFTRSGTTWTQQGSKLVGTGAAGAAFQGSSVALSSDGNTALVGASNDDGGAGAVWVFTRSGTTWTQQGSKLVGTGAVGAAFQGKSVSLSSDGNTALVGASNDDGGAGAVWVFTRSGTTWSQQGSKLVGTGAVGDAEQGTSVALSGDGSTALVGGPDDNNAAGATWVFVVGSVSPYTLTVTRSGSGTGTVTSAPAGIDCGTSGGSCAALFDAGSSVTLSAAAASGSTFTGWTGCGTTSGARCTVTISSDRDVAASFALLPPASTSRPAISGTAKAGKQLSCSEGSWTHDPTRFAYQWSYDGTPIQGATRGTYTVQSIDDGLTITCTVTASNAGGAGTPATSAGKPIPVPRVARCPAARGKLSGITLGLLRLGMTRAQALHAFAHSSNRGKKYEDFFCLTPRGVRVGIASPKLVKTLPKSERKLAGRVIWASTSSLYYSVHGVRCGATVAAASKVLKLTGPFHVGKNYWYLAPNGASTAVFKVRGGIIEEIGIGDKQLTQGHKAQLAFLTSFS